MYCSNMMKLGNEIDFSFKEFCLDGIKKLTYIRYMAIMCLKKYKVHGTSIDTHKNEQNR